MANARSRARQRRAQRMASAAWRELLLSELKDRFREARSRGNTTVWEFLHDAFRSEVRIWEVVRDHCRGLQALCEASPDDKEAKEELEMFLAMVAQVVEPRLAATTPDSVIRRHNTRPRGRNPKS